MTKGEEIVKAWRQAWDKYGSLWDQHSADLVRRIDEALSEAHFAHDITEQIRLQDNQHFLDLLQQRDARLVLAERVVEAAREIAGPTTGGIGMRKLCAALAEWGKG